MRSSLLLSLLVCACAPDARRSLEVPLSAIGVDPVSFTAAGDVTVTLDTAIVTLADIRLESPPEVTQRRSFFLIRSAQAHPGHDFSGDVACELLGSWELDLLGQGLDLGSSSCLEGELATGRVLLSGAPVVVLGGEVLLPDEITRAFHFEVPLDEEVAGIAIDAFLDPDAPPASIALGVRPSTMLSWVDWTTEDGDGDDLLTLADGLLANTVPFGALSVSSWTLTPNL